MPGSHPRNDLPSPCHFVDRVQPIVFGAIPMLRLLILVCLVAFVPGAAVLAQTPAQSAGTPAAQATPPTRAPGPASESTGPLVPNSLGAGVLVGPSTFLTQVSGRVVSTLGAVNS